MFVRNAWYVAAESTEITDKPLARTLLSDPVVLYRGENGKAVALYNRCVHRQAPLSLGNVEGNILRCMYHGLTYDADGVCQHVPGQTAVPPGSQVRSYPIIEKYNWVWLWMGDEDKADEALIPDFRWKDMEGWNAVEERLPIDGEYQLLVDNLLDLSHLGYLHQRTIGVTELAEKGTITTERDDGGVVVDRVTYDHPLPENMRSTNDIKGNIDRWSLINYRAPSAVIIESSVLPAGLCRTREERLNHPMQMILNFITPETEKSMHYFWCHARNHGLDDPDLDVVVRKRLKTTFNEDKEMIEGQQRNRNLDPAAQKIDINADQGALAGRQVVEAMLKQEQAVPV